MSATSLPLRLPTTALYMRFSVLSTILCLSTRVQGCGAHRAHGADSVNSIAGGHLSSMCYDNANRRLLAAVYQEEGYGANKKCWSGLYEINPSTAAVKELYRL